VSEAKDGFMAKKLHKLDASREAAFGCELLSSLRSGFNAGSIEIGSKPGDLAGPLLFVGDVNSIAVHGKGCEGISRSHQATKWRERGETL
jgi:hypothetical protein